MDRSAKAILSVIGVFTAGIGAWQVHENFIADRNACSISGHVYNLNGMPERAVAIGWAPNNPSVTGRLGERADFRKLAESGPDGAFAASCVGIADRSDGTFELLYMGGQFGDLPLPCLRVKYSYQRFPNRGKHSNVVLNNPGC